VFCKVKEFTAPRTGKRRGQGLTRTKKEVSREGAKGAKKNRGKRKWKLDTDLHR